MVWRLRHKDWVAGKPGKNRLALKRLVQQNKQPGVLGYSGHTPIAWCAVAPRESYPFLKRSRVLQPVDNQNVWSISCLFVKKSSRRSGVSAAMLRSAVEFARKQGAAVVEGYPVEPARSNAPDAFIWTGTPSAFIQAGFREVVRRSPTRPIMRIMLAGGSLKPALGSSASRELQQEQPASATRTKTPRTQGQG